MSSCSNLNCENTELCDAHIIPAAIGKDVIKSGGQKLALIAPKRKGWFQSGLFDPNILCSACDGKLGLFDAQAIELSRLVGTESEVLFRKQNFFVIKSNKQIDHQKLLMFGIAVAWRASISSKLDFSLGSNESWFHDILFSGSTNYPSVTVARLVGKTPLIDKGAMDAIGYPVRVRSKQNLSFARFCMRGLMFLVQTSQKKHSEWEKGSVIATGKSIDVNSLTGVLTYFENLGDLKQIQESKYIKEVLARS